MVMRARVREPAGFSSKKETDNERKTCQAAGERQIRKKSCARVRLLVNRLLTHHADALEAHPAYMSRRNEQKAPTKKRKKEEGSEMLIRTWSMRGSFPAP